MNGIKMFINLLFCLFGLLALVPLSSSTTDLVSNQTFSEDEHGNHFVHLGGHKLKVVDLRVSGEYSPGGPTYDLTGSSIQTVFQKVKQSPYYNESAWLNHTMPRKRSLHKRAKQIYTCQRLLGTNPIAIKPDDVQPAIDYLRTKQMARAYCYAASNTCTVLACHNLASVVLCSWRKDTVRIYCGDVAGPIAQHLKDTMVRDKSSAIRNIEFWQPCTGDPGPTWFSGLSFWDEDPTWSIHIYRVPGAKCKA
ncbi:hypothetical protein DRE_03399 [Drechslerella stenobrocha 248]|uniref:Lysine-specific metallo-endopeptidase domain-containing protein n=1 Tax=Drechslerella stenobrocha 248 TaxID=1043628 RepID=W7IE39_9PEZI|nr:hypothetical protein DRE_03399 [Drechslerella stenobrocha 248]